MFPENRPRRLRANETVRRLVRETRICPDNLIYPLFVREGRSIKEPIKSMTGQFRYSPDTAAQAAKNIFNKKIPAVLLFGIPSNKGPVRDRGAQKRRGRAEGNRRDKKQGA